MSWTTLMTAPTLGAGGQQALAEAGCEVHYLRDRRDAAEVERLMARPPFGAVISRTVALSRTAITACPTLKVICKHGVGVTNIDVDAATEHSGVYHARYECAVGGGADYRFDAERTLLAA